MTDVNAVVTAAHRLNEEKDEDSLLVQIGLREQAIEADPGRQNDPNLEVVYTETTMGPLDDLKRIGKRIANRWSKELHSIACGNESKDAKEREALLNSINLGEAAVIAAVAAALISLGVGAAIAAPLAPLIVRKFIWPAKDELCLAWGEALEENK
jgi:hypothetical protein